MDILLVEVHLQAMETTAAPLTKLVHPRITRLEVLERLKVEAPTMVTSRTHHLQHRTMETREPLLEEPIRRTREIRPLTTMEVKLRVNKVEATMEARRQHHHRTRTTATRIRTMGLARKDPATMKDKELLPRQPRAMEDKEDKEGRRRIMVLSHSLGKERRTTPAKQVNLLQHMAVLLPIRTTELLRRAQTMAALLITAALEAVKEARTLILAAPVVEPSMVSLRLEARLRTTAVLLPRLAIALRVDRTMEEPHRLAMAASNKEEEGEEVTMEQIIRAIRTTMVKERAVMEILNQAWARRTRNTVAPERQTLMEELRMDSQTVKGDLKDMAARTTVDNSRSSLKLPLVDTEPARPMALRATTEVLRHRRGLVKDKEAEITEAMVELKDKIKELRASGQGIRVRTLAETHMRTMEALASTATAMAVAREEATMEMEAATTLEHRLPLRLHPQEE